MGPRSAVGIQVDEGVVQAVELTTDGERLVVRRALCEPLRHGTFADGELVDPAEAADTIRRILRRHGLARQNLCLALGGRRTLARMIDIPGSSEGEAEPILQERIGRYAIYEDCKVDWRSAPIESSAIGLRTYLTASGVAEETSAVLAPLRRLGIYLLRIEPYALATLRALVGAAAEDGPAVLVSLRNERTDFLIARQNRPLLVRSVEQGTRELSLRPDAVDGLLIEAQRCVDYCRQRFPEETPRLWTCVQATEGVEGAAVLEAQLKEGLEGATVSPAPVWFGLEETANIAEGAEQAWAAVGAAMVGLARHENVEHLNLVPTEWTEIQQVQKHLVGVAASIASAILLTAAVSTLVRLTVGDTTKQAQAASIQMQANTTDVKVTSKLRERAAEAVARAELWKNVRAQAAPFDWVAGVRAIMAQTPEGVCVGKVQYRRGSIRIVGEAHSVDLAHRFVQNLARVDLLEDVGIERLVAAGEDATRLPSYTITCRFRAPRTPTGEQGKQAP